MSKTSQPQDRQIGGIDDSYLDKLDPNDPDFWDKYIKAVMAPIEPDENKEK